MDVTAQEVLHGLIEKELQIQRARMRQRHHEAGQRAAGASKKDFGLPTSCVKRVPIVPTLSGREHLKLVHRECLEGVFLSDMEKYGAFLETTFKVFPPKTKEDVVSYVLKYGDRQKIYAADDPTIQDFFGDVRWKPFPREATSDPLSVCDVWTSPDHDVIDVHLDGSPIQSVRCDLSPEVQTKVIKAMNGGDQNLVMELLRDAGALVPPKGFEDGCCTLGIIPPVN